jgi:alpha-beta hydrolase superfamily lysophospholipase
MRNEAKWSGTLSSVQMLMSRHPLGNVQVNGSSVVWTLPDADAPLRFQLQLRDNGQLEGLATPAGVTNELPREAAAVLKRGMRVLLTRTATPSDVPYRSETVRFRNGPVTLEGEVYTPKRHGRWPAVLLLQGSSTNERFHYYAYAEHFARAGIVALVYDKRGSGRSSGNYETATYDDLLKDAEAGLTFLRQRPEVDDAMVGVWGLSQGGVIAPMLAAKSRNVAFVIAVSAPGMTLGECAAYQDRLRLLQRGYSKADADLAASVHSQLTQWAAHWDGKGRAGFDAVIRPVSNAAWIRYTGIPLRVPDVEKLRNWYWSGRAVNPVRFWGQVDVPVLLVYGEADELVPARESLNKVSAALRANGNSRVTGRMYAGADHLIRVRGARDRTHSGEGGFAWPKPADGYVAGVTGWILQRTSVRKPSSRGAHGRKQRSSL